MRWMPGMPRAAGTGQLRQLAARYAARGEKLHVALFRLDEQVQLDILRVQLAAELAALGIGSAITTGGPGRVAAALEGKLSRAQVLVVPTTSDDGAQDRLMDLVEWLLANGREQLAKALVFVPVGPNLKLSGSFPFKHVPLATDSPAPRAGGGMPRWRRSAPGVQDALLEAVLDQALGLA